MRYTTLAFSLFCLLSLPALSINAENFTLSKEAMTALKQFNPTFKNWKLEDYSATAQKEAKEDKGVPFYLTFDVNNDGKPDFIVDGHDGKHNLLLSLTSSTKGYRVAVLDSTELVDPKTIESWNDGVKERGLNYYMWPDSEGKGFILVYPQQSDEHGKLLMDGEIIDYLFEEGVYNKSYLII